MLRIRLWWNLITCIFHHPKNMPKVFLNQTDGNRRILEPFDVLAFHAHSLIGKSIQICTDSKYNHVALYIGGGRVLHAVGKGLLIQDLKEAIENSDKFVDVYRYHTPGNGQALTYAQKDRMTKIANDYYRNRERYAFEALFILAIVTELRHNTGFAGRKMIEDSFAALTEAFENKKEPVICSEIIYRIFDEAGVSVRIIPEGLYKEYRNSNSETIQELIAMKENIFKVNPDFVTPKDLVMSPDFNFVGELSGGT